jgi:hypothetical protein
MLNVNLLHLLLRTLSSLHKSQTSMKMKRNSSLKSTMRFITKDFYQDFTNLFRKHNLLKIAEAINFSYSLTVSTLI